MSDQTKTGAFFDVDYTILYSNSASLWIKFMRREGELGIGDVLTSLYYLAQYKMNLLDFEKVAAKEIAKSAGENEALMIAKCERWFQEMVIGYIYPEAVELIQAHQGRGDLICLLSAATTYLGAPLAKHLGVEHYLCNRLEVKDGLFTGKLLRPYAYGTGKIELAREFAGRHGLKLEDCWYYSDSITDLPVLEAFGHPMVINPDPLLRKEAVKRGWPIRVLAKPGAKPK